MAESNWMLLPQNLHLQTRQLQCIMNEYILMPHSNSYQILRPTQIEGMFSDLITHENKIVRERRIHADVPINCSWFCKPFCYFSELFLSKVWRENVILHGVVWKCPQKVEFVERKPPFWLSEVALPDCCKSCIGVNWNVYNSNLMSKITFMHSPLIHFRTIVNTQCSSLFSKQVAFLFILIRKRSFSVVKSAWH